MTGRCDHDFHSRGHLTRNSDIGFIGDIGFADDTCLLGEGNEITKAEALLEQTMQDWRGKVHPGKTEGLRLQYPPRNLSDVRFKGESGSVRHVGGILEEQGGHTADTNAKKAKAYFKIGQTARAWFFGKRNTTRVFPHTLRVKIMKAVLMPTLTCFGKTRTWTPTQIKQMQAVIDWAAQRCLLIRHRWKETYTCEDCGQTWRTSKQHKQHTCPVRPAPKRAPKIHPQVACQYCHQLMSAPNVSRHEEGCRGSEVANRTCEKCHKVLGPVMARKNNEARCSA